MFKSFRHIEDIEPDDPWWKKEVLDKLGDKLKGGYFDLKNLEKNNLTLGKVKRASRRAVEFCSKSRSAKKDYGFIIIERSNLERLEDVVDRGLFASNYHEGVKQHIEFKGDVRCKPDRGTFLCKIPKLETIFAFCPKRKQKPTLDGFLVIVEFVKREQQHIQGTSYTWIHTERDYSNQWCYPLAIMSYRDPNAPPPPAPKKKQSREEDNIKRERRDSRERSRSPSDRRRDRSRDHDRYQRDRRDRSRDRDRHRDSHRDSHRDDYRVKRERREDDYRDSSSRDRRDEDYRESRREDEYRRRDRDRKENRDDADHRRGSVSSSVEQRWPGEDHSRYEATPKYDRRSSSFGQDMNSSYNIQHSGDGVPHQQGQNGFDGHNHQNRVPPSNGHYHGSSHHNPAGPSGMRPNHRMPSGIRPGFNGQNSYSHGNPRFNNMRMPHGNGYGHQRGQPRQPFDRSMSMPNPHMSPDGIPHPENFPQRGHRGPPNEAMTPNRGRFPSTGYQNSPGFQGSPHISPPGRPDLARRNSEQTNNHKTPSTAQSLLTHSPVPPLGTPLQTQGRKDHFCREYIKERLENMRSSRKAITYWSGKLAFGDDKLDASLMQYTDPHALHISESLLHFSKLKSVLFNDLRSEIQKLNLNVVKPKKSMHRSFAGIWSCYPAYIKNTEENHAKIEKVFDRDTKAVLSEVPTSKAIVILIKIEQSGLSDLLNWNQIESMMPDDSMPGFFFVVFAPLSNAKEFSQVRYANGEINLAHPNPPVHPTEPQYDAVQNMMQNLNMNITHEDKYFHRDYRSNWNINHDIISQLQKLTNHPRCHRETITVLANMISPGRHSQIPTLLEKFTNVIANSRYFETIEEVMSQFIKETKRLREAANAQTQAAPTSQTVPTSNNSQNPAKASSNHVSQPSKSAAAPKQEKPRPQLNLQPLTLPQVHSTPVPEHLVKDTPPASRPPRLTASKLAAERTLANYVPSPKRRAVDVPEQKPEPNRDALVHLDKMKKNTQNMVLLEAAGAKNDGAAMLKGLSFAETILLRDKNNVKIHPPADSTFEEHYESRLIEILRQEALYLSDEFTEGKKLTRVRDEDFNPTVKFSIPRAVLNAKPLNVDPHTHHEHKTLLINALPRMKESPPNPPKSHSRVKIGEQDKPNFTRTVANVDDPMRFSSLRKLSKMNYYVFPATKMNIQRLRLGQNQLVKQEADDSDEEEDRKGGMQKEDINKWLQDIENCWAELDRNVDYPRHSEGPNKDHIHEDYPEQVMLDFEGLQ